MSNSGLHTAALASADSRAEPSPTHGGTPSPHCPSRFDPHTYTAPRSESATECAWPAATAEHGSSSSAATRRGQGHTAPSVRPSASALTSLALRSTWPSCPMAPLPQLYTLPFLSRHSECSPPAATKAGLRRRMRRRWRRRRRSDVAPEAASVLAPVASPSPSLASDMSLSVTSLSAADDSPPALTSSRSVVAPAEPAASAPPSSPSPSCSSTRSGVISDGTCCMHCDVRPQPSWPYSLYPHANTRYVSSSASVCRPPHATCITGEGSLTCLGRLARW
mmetsp:Transcript_11583/g.48663  ORF Transcript_11583/g.48663 Transcript_11583/m.48663 type:complete len:278 (+) Transcript_11583:1223-2056(+)